jgi:hypothetical protein
MDARKNNGGNSTKAKGADKRKNEYRNAIEQAASIDDVADVLKMLLEKAKVLKDVKAAQLFLEYTIGKPLQSIDHTTNGNDLNSTQISFKRFTIDDE